MEGLIFGILRCSTADVSSATVYQSNEEIAS